MLPSPRRAGVTGPDLLRLLARLPGPDIPDASQPLSDPLGQWLRWNDAIALSAALGGHAPAAPTVPAGVRERPPARPDAADDADDCAQVRAFLARGIDELSRQAATDIADDFASHRHRYATRQQAMESAIGPLRARLRARLAARSADHARLAAVDAVMEQVLGGRERGLLAGLPALLETHFRALRQAAPAEAASAPPPPAARRPAAPPRPPRWLLTFRQDMQDLLLAELDFRLQPALGLLDALQADCPHALRTLP